MQSAFSFWAFALVIASLFGSTLGRVPVDEIYKKRQFDVKAKLTKKDLVCEYDDYLQSFEQYLDDSVPFCSAFIGIPKETATSTIYTKTTIESLVTVTTTKNTVATIASDTVTVTITPAPSAALRKRQATDILPAAEIISSCLAPTGLNLTLINSASSACSCLFIPETTVTLATTLFSTRVISGVDYKFTTATNLITSGTTTVTLTVIPSITPIPSFNTTQTVPASSGLSIATLTSPVLTSSGLVVPPFSVDVTGRSGIADESSSLPTSAPTTIIFTSLSSAIPSLSVNITGIAPESSSLSTPIPASPASSGISSALPPLSVNTTGPMPASSGLPISTTSSGILIPPFSIDVTGRSGIAPESSTVPTSVLTSPVFTGVSSVVPPSSVNTTGIVPGSSGFPASVTAFPSSGIPTASSNGSSPTSSGASPSSTSSLYNCPADNGTLYTTLGQTWEILCQTNVIGPSIQGIYVPSFFDCVNDCAIANVGFSQSQCYAASYIPNNAVGSDCFFKNLTNSGSFEYNPKATSAILINNTVPTNFTLAPDSNTTASSSIDLNSTYPTGPTAVPSANITSISYTSSISANATNFPSSFPTASPNITSPPSSFPTIPVNSSSIPSFSGFPPGNENRTVPASSGFSSTFPSATTNASLCLGVIETVTESPSAVTVTSFITATTIFTTSV